jgi:hypothetical protein
VLVCDVYISRCRQVPVYIDYVHADEHSRTIFVVFSQVLDSSLRMVRV